MTISIPAPSHFVPYSIHKFRYISSCIIDGYIIFPSLNCTISYPQSMFTYNVFLSASFPFVSTLDSTPSLLDLISTTFPTRSLVEGGPIYRVSTFFHPIINFINFANMYPCRIKKNPCKHVLCSAVWNWHVVGFNPVLSKEITYINVPRLPNAQIRPAILYLYCTLIILEEYVRFNGISLNSYEQKNTYGAW